MKNLLHRRMVLLTGIVVLLLAASHFCIAGGRYLSGITWPEPEAVTPGDKGGPPSDAIVLFDGKNFDEWHGAEKWKVDPDGGFTVKGGMRTKRSFGDCQLHIEFASPMPVRGSGQGRGNNGIGFMGARYELQVLDSYDNKTYPEGQCASIYNQRPPMVNASRKPGEWQTLDVIFTAPRFADDGSLQKPAYMTVLHNGILVHNHVELQGDTPFNRKPAYKKHPEKQPLVLMYHGDPVRFRNIWIREFRELESKKEKP